MSQGAEKKASKKKVCIKRPLPDMYYDGKKVAHTYGEGSGFYMAPSQKLSDCFRIALKVDGGSAVYYVIPQEVAVAIRDLLNDQLPENIGLA